MSQSHSMLQKDALWKILVDTVHALPMYKNHKRYVEEVMIRERPEISAQELAVQLNIPLGEALVLLDEIRGEKPQEKASGVVQKSTDRSLLDFSG